MEGGGVYITSTKRDYVFSIFRLGPCCSTLDDVTPCADQIPLIAENYATPACLQMRDLSYWDEFKEFFSNKAGDIYKQNNEENKAISCLTILDQCKKLFY